MYKLKQKKIFSLLLYIFQLHKMDIECTLIRCVKNVVNNSCEIKILFTTFISYLGYYMLHAHAILEESLGICYNRTFQRQGLYNNK